MFDSAKQDALNQRCLDRPKPGDYWHEMYVPVARVLDADQDRVLLQKLSGRAGTEISKTDPKPRIMTITAFRRWLSYNSIPGTWAHVIPEHLKNAP